MTHLATSKILEEIIIEFRKQGLSVPPKVLTDLKSARVLMTVEATQQKGTGDASMKIDEYLSSVEAYLITEAQKKFPPEKIDEWLRRLDAASYDTCGVCVPKEKDESKFITGVPRDQKWIRVEPLSSLPAEKLKQLAAETNLSVREEKDGHLTVYGNEEDIKRFVKKMTEQAAK
ncbi:MAG: DUF2096 domain-containing protein [Candidatus Bathyarchaeota archaeon]|nr:DUF2096 domain-containing protein [Candidatus Bathyarchaeota archaeon]